MPKNVKSHTQSFYNDLVQKTDIYDEWDSVGPDGVKQMLCRVYPSGVKTWHLKFRLAGKQKFQKIGDFGLTLLQARKIARDAIAAAAEGKDYWQEKKKEFQRVEDEKNQITTVGQLFEKYMPHLLAKNKRGDADAQTICNIFRTVLDCDLNTDTVLSAVSCWVASRQADSISESTIQRNLHAFFRMLRWGEEQHVIPPLAIKKSMLPIKKDTPKNTIRPMSPSERSAFLDGILKRKIEKGGTDYFCAALTIAYFTGMRHGSLSQLQWSDIDFETPKIHLRAEIMKTSHTNGKEWTIPANPYVVTALRELAQYQLQHHLYDPTYVFPAQKKKQGLQPRLQKQKSQPYMKFINGTVWKNFKRDNNLPDEIRWHDIRHDFATRLIAAGTRLTIVKELMCHEKIEMTMRYVHESASDMARAVEKL